MHEVAVVGLLGVLLIRTLVPRRRPAPPPLPGPVVAVELVPSPSTSLPPASATAPGVAVRLAVDVGGTAMVHTAFLPGGRVSPAALAAVVADLLGRLGVAVPTKRRLGRVYLISQDAKRLLGLLDGAKRDARIRQLGADVHHADLTPVSIGQDRWAISVIDFAGFFLDYGTEEVASFIGFGSVEINAQHLARQVGPQEALRLATECRAVAVIARAFSEFRHRLLSRWGVDPLRNRTLASLAARIFLGRFARSGPAPWTSRRIVKKRRTATGFRDERRREQVFAGQREVRLAAARALWGGHMIAYRRGLVVQPLVELDATSLYPFSAILQPMPYQRTRWRALRGLDELNEVEGFLTVDFEFPRGFPYPSLPTVRDGVSRLHFTRRGRSTCTVAEVRVALRLGATVSVIESQVFVPGARERRHDLGAYQRAMLADKAAATKGTIPYEVAKLLANALVGKLAERFGGSTILDFERAAQLQGFSAGLGSAVAASPALHSALARSIDAGAMFAPEWAALTIGRARAIMGDIIASGQALLVSTDAVLVSPGADITCPGLTELRSVGSDMRLQHAADGAFIARNRCYALLRRPRNVTSSQTVLAANADWAVIRVARHGSLETAEEFAETVLSCLAAGVDVAPRRVRRRRVGAQEAVRLGLEIDQEIAEPHRTTFRWDGKRRLVDRDVNPFADSTPTEPYESVGAMEGAEQQAQRAQRQAERRSAQQEGRRLRRVLRLLADGLPVEEVARETGVPAATVEEILEHMPVDDGEGQGA